MGGGNAEGESVFSVGNLFSAISRLLIIDCISVSPPFKTRQIKNYLKLTQCNVI